MNAIYNILGIILMLAIVVILSPLALYYMLTEAR